MDRIEIRQRLEEYEGVIFIAEYAVYTIIIALIMKFTGHANLSYAFVGLTILIIVLQIFLFIFYDIYNRKNISMILGEYFDIKVKDKNENGKKKK